MEKFRFKKGIVGFKISQVYGNVLDIYYDDKVSIEELEIANKFLDDDFIITYKTDVTELFEFVDGLENNKDGFKEVFELYFS